MNFTLKWKHSMKVNGKKVMKAGKICEVKINNLLWSKAGSAAETVQTFR